MCAITRDSTQLAGNAHTSNIIEYADCSDEHAKLMGIDRDKSNNCKDSMNVHTGAGEMRTVVRAPGHCCQQWGSTDGNLSCKAKPKDTQITWKSLKIMSIKQGVTKYHTYHA